MAEKIINDILGNGFSMISKERLQNLHTQCLKFKDSPYSFVECGVAKGGALALMKYTSGPSNNIYGFDSFEDMPEITVNDIDDTYNKSNIHCDWGNLSQGIESVYKTFSNLNLNFINVNLVKGFFADTLTLKNVEQIGEIAVLRLDGDWYDSTIICLEKFYDKVVKGGVIIIDDYGHWIGAKKATDDFRRKNNIDAPLIQTDYTEVYWYKQ